MSFRAKVRTEEANLQSKGEHKNEVGDGRQADRGDRAESLGPVYVRVRPEDEDCDKKRLATRSCNGSAFSIHSWPRS